jgi:Gametolysin peptidase M11
MPFRRSALAFAALLLLLVTVPMPAFAAPATAHLEGTLELLHGEDFETGKATFEYRLQTARENVRLKFADEPPAGFVNGAKVRVHGKRDGPTLVALDGAAAGEILSSAPTWSGPRKLAVILVNFTNDRSEPFSRAFADSIVFGNPNSVRAYFEEESFGAVRITGATFDWITIPYSNTACDNRAWERAAKAGLAARGENLSAYTNFMLVFPQTSNCPWRGMGHLPGWATWLNGAPTLRIAVHELGHNFGVHHATALTCTRNGERVRLSGNCTQAEYGDPFTTMGAAQARHGHNLSLVQMGYMPSTAARTIAMTGTYVLTHASSATGTRILGIPRGDGTWMYLEYRRPYGTHFDNFRARDPVVTGVTVRLGSTWTAMARTQLLDMRPSTGTFADAPLRVGFGFRDRVSGTRIFVVAAGATTAKITITLPSDVSAPTAPAAFLAKAASTSEVALTWGAATDNRAVAGYRISRDGALVATTAATARSLADVGLAAGTPYAYSIRAFDGSGNEGPALTSATTTKPAPDVTPPTQPTATVTPENPSWANLSWTAATDDRGVTSYRILRDGALYSTVGHATLHLRVPRGSSYRVIAIDAAGNASAASEPQQA